MTAPVQPGSPAKISDERGYFTVTRIFEDHVELYGGDDNHEGRRQFRAVKPERVRPRKLTAREKAAAGR